MPFILFKRQRELLTFFKLLLEHQTTGLVEKSRDMGATWLACAFSIWLWIFYPGASIGWGSRKEQLVDNIGDPDSIFEKMRMLIRNIQGSRARKTGVYGRIHEDVSTRLTPPSGKRTVFRGALEV